MKAEIHPKYDVVKVRCTCGNNFETRSSSPGELSLELCNECHPFFTGKQKLVDTGGRVERFNKRYGDRAAKKSSTKKS
jgi:large subunit ribosomal protein L31